MIKLTVYGKGVYPFIEDKNFNDYNETFKYLRENFGNDFNIKFYKTVDGTTHVIVTIVAVDEIK